MADKIGALWEKESRKGQEFLSGEIEVGGTRIQIVCFRNTRKEPGSKQPDWNILEGDSKPRRSEGEDQPLRSGGREPARPVFDDDESTPF